VQRKNPDLVNQRRMLDPFCAARDIAVDEWVEEIGGGLNFKRARFLAVIDRIVVGEIGILVIAHQDRLARCEIVVLGSVCKRRNLTPRPPLRSAAGVRSNKTSENRVCRHALNTESLSPEQRNSFPGHTM